MGEKITVKTKTSNENQNVFLSLYRRIGPIDFKFQLVAAPLCSKLHKCYILATGVAQIHCFLLFIFHVGCEKHIFQHPVKAAFIQMHFDRSVQICDYEHS